VKHADLIIDVGMHRGEDSEFYLAKGFNVVAIEANPSLATEVRTRLASEVREGRLRIIEGAVAPTTDTQRLAVADDVSVWSSLSSEFVARNQAAGTSYRHVDVAGIRFEDVLEEVGIPYLLKIDIEGHDMLCVEALHRFSERPDYISIESNVSVNDAPFERVFDELAQLWTLGYRAFKYLDQSANQDRRCPNPPREGTYVDARFNEASSGPFGEETPQRWLSIDQALLRAQQLRWRHRLVGSGGRWSQTMPSRAYRTILQRSPPKWYDLHARLVESGVVV
jgi:FkbM family methyltransferase